MAGKRIDDAIKEKVIQDHADGTTKKAIAENLGISVSSVSRIIEANSPGNKSVYQTGPRDKTERQKKIEDIERRIALLEKRILEREPGKRF
jgi:predicted transcriptional regulator